MAQIPTAKEFVLNENDGYLAGDYSPNEVYYLMIEFAKLHVEQALKEAVKNLPYDDKMNQSLLDQRAILNSYPPENIK
jgi:hypothetical protein